MEQREESAGCLYAFQKKETPKSQQKQVANKKSQLQTLLSDENTKQSKTSSQDFNRHLQEYQLQLLSKLMTPEDLQKVK
jgi:hypothetical protein